MPNEKIGENPLTDLLIHGLHPFPEDVEATIRQRHQKRPACLHELGMEPSEWEKAGNLDAGRAWLKAKIEELEET